jgi:maleylpyruvate isomerase
MDVDPRLLNRHVEGAARAHQSLLETIGDVTDDDVRAPSLLGGWSRGHVLTHLARNADSHVHLLECARRGEVGEQYSGGYRGRVAAIEAGSSRSAEELVADVRRSIYGLEAAWSQADHDTWRGSGVNSKGDPIPMGDIVFLRWREVEVHHADLGLGFAPADWSSDYVRYELDRQVMLWRSRRSLGLTTLPARALELDPTTRLAWLLGRVSIEGLPEADPF